jgi:hypothetical protein
MTFIFAAFLGLYPVAMPAGQEQFGEQVAAQLHRGAGSPGVKAFDLISPSRCAPDETGCLAAAARGANVDAVVSAEVHSTPEGYRWTLRDVAAGGKLLSQRSGEVQGGPERLASALERGVRETLDAAPSAGWLRVRDAGPFEEVNATRSVEPLPVTPARVLVTGIALLAAGGAIGLMSGSMAASGLMFALAPNGFAFGGVF